MSTQRRLYSERLLALAIGIDRDRLREARETVPELANAALEDGGEIRFTARGALLACLQFGLKKDAARTVLTQCERLPGQSSAVIPFPVVPDCDLVVSEEQRSNRNPGIVVCLAEDHGESQKVRVRSAKNFAPGMVLKNCRHVEGSLWSYCGPLPRWSGRW